MTWTYEQARLPELKGLFEYSHIFWLHIPYGDLIRARYQAYYTGSVIDIDDTLTVSYGIEYTLSGQVRNWLKANYIGFSFVVTNLQYRLEIDTYDNAMKFKLRWC